MQDVTGICVYISEARKKQISGGDPMEDQGIVALFFDRSEQAIAETDKKYGAYCYAVGQGCKPGEPLVLWHGRPGCFPEARFPAAV